MFNTYYILHVKIRWVKGLKQEKQQAWFLEENENISKNKTVKACIWKYIIYTAQRDKPHIWPISSFSRLWKESQISKSNDPKELGGKASQQAVFKWRQNKTKVYNQEEIQYY